MTKKVLTFINAYEELPEVSGEYLCYIDDEWLVLNYSAKHKLFNAYDAWEYKDATKCAIMVSFWAKLPIMF